MAQQGKNLDSLMMAYADLSGGSRGSSFKGPPLKEVKIEKAAPPVFKPSSKARDWSNIENVFDDTFVLSPTLAANQIVEIQHEPEFSAFSQWQQQQESVQQIRLESHAQPPSKQIAMTDDWGDFQDFQSPSETSKPIVQPVKTIVEDDDFADFVTATCPQPSNTIPQQQVNPQMRSEPFSNATVISSIPAQPQGSVNPLSNTVGLRLASFQEESPVHNFKGKTGSRFEAPRLSVSESPSRFEAFFGGTEDDALRCDPAPVTKTDTFTTLPIFEASISSSAVLDAPIATLPSVTPSPMFVGMTPSAALPNVMPTATLLNDNAGLPSLPPPITVSNDKYSALTDLLSISDDFSFSAPQIEAKLNTELSSTPELLPAQTFQTSLLPSIFSDSKTAVFQTNFNLPAKAGNSEEEDFGDFISGGPTSFGQAESAVSKSLFSAFTPVRSNVPVMTWHESSPPPMPADDDDNDLDDLNTSNSSANFHDDIPISDSFIQLSTDVSQPDMMDHLSAPNVNSPPDSLSLNSFEAQSSSNTDSSPPPSGPVIASPPAATKIEEPVRSFVPPRIDNLKSPYREWLQALTQILETLSSCADTFSNVSDDRVLDEVLDSDDGSNYIKNVVEIYRVFKRIQMSYSMAVWNEAVQSLCEETEKSWKVLIVNLKSRSDVVPSRAAFDFSRCVLSSGTSAATVCAFCLLSLTTFSKETTNVVRESVISVDGRKYHSTCANFWVNCVDLRLPKLV